MGAASDFWKFFRGRRRLNARTRPNELGRREAADQRPPPICKKPWKSGVLPPRRKSSSDRTSKRSHEFGQSMGTAASDFWEFIRADGD